MSQSLSYDQRYRPAENKLIKNGTTVDDHVYAEDAVGNITAVNDALNAGYNRAFGYDDLNRLTTANSGANLWGTASGNGHTYDAMGNMTKLQLGASTTVFGYQPGASGSSGLPLLSSITTNGVPAAVSYDAIGSTASVGSTSYSYGARELLASNGSSVQSYMYDAARQRVQAQLPDGTQRVSLFDPSDHLLAESALSTSPSSIAYDYVWFGDRPVAQLDATSTHWTYADHLGTPLIQTDANAATTWQAEYAPYGQVWSLRAGDVHQPVRLPGQTAEQFDAGANGLTAFSYNNARWFAPSVGRYTQPDPLGMSGGPNQYEYALDNPMTYFDRSGRQSASALPIDAPIEAPFPWWMWLLPGPAIGVGLVLSMPGDEAVGRWRCTAQCNVQQIDKCATCPPRTFGMGSGSSMEAACREAKRHATQNTPRGCYPRHCKCDCVKR